jgi:hypothetical protein
VSQSCSSTCQTPTFFTEAPPERSCTVVVIPSSVSYHTGTSSSSFLCGGMIVRWSWSCRSSRSSTEPRHQPPPPHHLQFTGERGPSSLPCLVDASRSISCCRAGAPRNGETSGVHSSLVGPPPLAAGRAKLRSSARPTLRSPHAGVTPMDRSSCSWP